MVLATTLGVATGGCRVSERDVRRWETTERGPDKLVAVVTHDKYEPALRVESALALVRMKPRSGRRIGIPRLVDAVAALSAEERKMVVDGMVPTLVSEMGKPPPVAQAGQPIPPDSTIPFKDAAFALLSYDKSALVANEDVRQKLSNALIGWCVADFEHRFDNASQMYGLEQVVRFLQAPVARPLATLITPDSRKLSDLAKLISENGDNAAKEEASKKLVEVAKYTADQAWLDRIKETVREANTAAKLDPTPDQLKLQLETAQDEQLERVFGAMRRVGGRAVVEYCLDFAANPKLSEKRRVRALAAIEGNFDQKNPSDIQRILAIAASDEAPDKVRDLAFSRIGEMPREKVVSKLYDIFNNKRWQVRWEAAGVAIRMSSTDQIPEIVGKLSAGRVVNFAMTEAITYGNWMGDPKVMPEKGGKTGRAMLDPYLKEGPLVARLVALGYFFNHGAKTDLPVLAAFESDRTPVPKCDDKQKECEWKCEVPRESNPKEKETKDIATVGDFVKYCIELAVKEAK